MNQRNYAASPSSSEQTLSVQTYRNLPYVYDGEAHPRKVLDLYQPANNVNKAPIIVYFHGGAWVERSKDEHSHIGEALVSKLRVCVAIINYRLSPMQNDAPPLHHPAHVIDCAEAIHFLATLQSNSTLSVKYDPKRMVLFGHSAGAHMATCLSITALWVANREAGPLPIPLSDKLLTSLCHSIRAVVGFAGIYDLVMLDRDFPTYNKWFLEAAFGSNDVNERQRASPLWWLQYARQQPTSRKRFLLPHLLLHSPQDCLVNEKQTLEFAKSLAEYYGEPTPVPLNTIHPSRHVLCYTSLNGGHWEPIRHCAPCDPEDQFSPLLDQFIHTVDYDNQN
jgi:acetyl esterase/lipase